MINYSMKPTKALIPYERNPRNNDKAVDAVAESIKEFGFLQPIVIDKDGVIAAGHTRLKAAEKLGLEQVPVVMADELTEEQIKAFRLADNKTAELAGWDFDLLSEELKGITELNMAAFGFDQSEVEDPNETVEDDYSEGKDIEQRVSTGDKWQLGEHFLVCGDSSSDVDISTLLGGVKPRMVFTDPPYGVAIGDKNKTLQSVQKAGRIVENIEGDTLNEDALYTLLVKCFSTLKAHCSDDCAYYVSAPQGGSLGMMMMMMMRDSGLEVKHNLVWVKNTATFSLGRLDYNYRHEPIFYTWGKKHRFFGGYDTTVIDDTTQIDKMSKSELKEALRAYQAKEPDSVIYCDKPMKCDLHPTMKPIKLIARFIINSSEKGDPVADIFGGSGSTLIACEQLGRKCYMMELDPHYCDVIIDRWEKFTGEKARRINGKGEDMEKENKTGV